MNRDMLNVHSIFLSIDGEVNHRHQGSLSTFVRLAECNLRCDYCDTVRAQESTSGGLRTIQSVGQSLIQGLPKKATITGGEPLLQMVGVRKLISYVHSYRPRFFFTIETNGTIPIDPLWAAHGRVSFVVDYKLDQEGAMDPGAFLTLGYDSFIKFVIGNLAQFKRAVEVVKDFEERGGHAKVAFSPMHKMIDPAALVAWIQGEDIPDIIFNLQIHKYIWPGATNEV